jgi:hypothetical protein
VCDDLIVRAALGDPQDYNEPLTVGEFVKQLKWMREQITNDVRQALLVHRSGMTVLREQYEFIMCLRLTACSFSKDMLLIIIIWIIIIIL